MFEKNTDNWDTTNAKNNMEAALNANGNKIDAVLSENDSMATGVVQALSAVGLKVPVSGQDGDTAALNRVALGTQAVSVWKNAFALGETAGEHRDAAVRRHRDDRCQGPGRPAGGRGSGVPRRRRVHDAGRQDRPVGHPDADGDHQGQPEGHDRRRLGRRRTRSAPDVAAGSMPACG